MTLRASSDGPACNWWLRSVNATNTTNFCNVNTSGTANNNNAYNSNGFAPGFKKELGVGTSSGNVKQYPTLKGELAPWRMARKGFNPKLAIRCGRPDAACMAGEFDGSSPVT